MIEVTRGTSPVVLGLPHTGTVVPEDCAERLNETGSALADTDWNIHTLYAGLLDQATTVRTPIHRYVIDANRSPDDDSLYPGRNTTSLCPLTDFDGRPIYRAGREPDAAEIARRTALYHAPYHAALRQEVERVRARNGFAVLYDCHSIRGTIPFLFDGRLPDFNIGDNGGSSCAETLTQGVSDICAAADGYSHVVNGRFKGGWTTRAYGRPGDGVHAIQMELAQSTYMREAAPWTYHADDAARLRRILSQILEFIAQWRPE